MLPKVEAAAVELTPWRREGQVKPTRRNLTANRALASGLSQTKPPSLFTPLPFLWPAARCSDGTQVPCPEIPAATWRLNRFAEQLSVCLCDVQRASAEGHRQRTSAEASCDAPARSKLCALWYARVMRTPRPRLGFFSGASSFKPEPSSGRSPRSGSGVLPVLRLAALMEKACFMICSAKPRSNSPPTEACSLCDCLSKTSNLGGPAGPRLHLCQMLRGHIRIPRVNTLE